VDEDLCFAEFEMRYRGGLEYGILGLTCGFTVIDAIMLRLAEADQLRPAHAGVPR
jgi:hypothetical protein